MTFLPAASFSAGALAAALAQAPPSTTCADIEEFLRNGSVGAMRNLPRGVTLPKRATLTQGGLKHDASIQTVNETKTSFQGKRGMELNFRDFWGYNIAGYEIAKMLDLNMVPPYVERKAGGSSASFTWWVDDAMMEIDRLQKKIQPPDVEAWNQQMFVARVFNQLIRNSDDNLTNFLITKDWQLWMIDFTRAFRTPKDIAHPENLVRIDRRLLANLKKLDRQALEEKVVKPRYLTRAELDGVMARRDKIVDFFERQIAAKGESAVLFDLDRVGQPCGVGL